MCFIHNIYIKRSIKLCSNKTEQKNETQSEVNHVPNNDNFYLLEKKVSIYAYQVFIQNLLEMERDIYLNREKYFRKDSKKEHIDDYRNGYKCRILKTALGEMQIMIPQTRKKYRSAFIGAYEINEHILLNDFYAIYFKKIKIEGLKNVVTDVLNEDVSKKFLKKYYKKISAQFDFFRNKTQKKIEPDIEPENEKDKCESLNA